MDNKMIVINENFKSNLMKFVSTIEDIDVFNEGSGSILKNNLKPVPVNQVLVDAILEPPDVYSFHWIANGNKSILADMEKFFLFENGMLKNNFGQTEFFEPKLCVIPYREDTNKHNNDKVLYKVIKAVETEADVNALVVGKAVVFKNITIVEIEGSLIIYKTKGAGKNFKFKGNIEQYYFSNNRMNIVLNIQFNNYIMQCVMYDNELYVDCINNFKKKERL